MRCPHCKGSISVYNFLREKHCPACGELLKRMPTREQVKETIISFAEDRGWLFWTLVYLMVITVIAFLEQIFGTGNLFDYLVAYKLRTFVIALYSGTVFDFVAKANVEVTAVRIKFIFKPPAYLRAYRRWTNVFLVLGLGMSFYAQIKWPNYVSVLPATSLITSAMLGLIWALMGLLLTEDDMNDKRIRYFMEEMRIGRLRYYHRASAIYIGGITVAGVAYYNLVQISGLWFYIWNARIVYDVVNFFRMYFGWVDKFVK